MEPKTDHCPRTFGLKCKRNCSHSVVMCTCNFLLERFLLCFDTVHSIPPPFFAVGTVFLIFVYHDESCTKPVNSWSTLSDGLYTNTNLLCVLCAVHIVSICLTTEKDIK